MSRQERIKIERPSAKSFFAFFLLPQFWRSFEHFSHIRPIFVQLLATSLAQANLLPPYHPAIRYGAQIDGKKIKIFSLLGEAWYHLRNNPHAGLYQWGTFSAVIMMFVCMISSLVLGLFYFMSGSVARAQIFDHPTGFSTDMANVSLATSNPLIDRSPAGAHGDLAISILDRVFRQGASGGGGDLQVNIGPMFGTYSTAVLVLASMFIFFHITIMVVETARSGKIGGGRRNIVWTPIRFVVAIGLLVPIGGAFNSGQFIMMKFAEIGSNLGSNLWSNYVAGTMDLSLLGNQIRSVNPTSTILSPLHEMTLCAAKHNIANEVGLGSAVFTAGGYPGTPLTLGMAPMVPIAAWGSPHREYVRPILDQTAVLANAPNITIYFGNEDTPNLCGSINLPNPNGIDIINYDPDYAAAYPAVPVGTAFDAMALFKQEVRQAEWDTINNLLPDMQEMACHMVSLGEGANPALYGNSCPTGVTYSNACQGGLGGGYGQNPIDTSCFNDFVDRYMTARNADVAAAKATYLDPYFTSGAFVTEMAAQGWAGMGVWYYKIASINRTFRSSIEPETVVAGGNLAQGGESATAEDDGDCSLPGWACSAWGFAKGAWGFAEGAWEVTKNIAGAIEGGIAWLGGEGWSNFFVGFPVTGADDINLEAGKKIIHWILNKMKQGDGAVLMTIGGYGQNVHPISEMARAGAEIMDKALGIYGTIAVLSLLSALPVIGSMIEALMMGPVGGFIGTMGGIAFVPAMLFVYYVPLIPWLRVMFATVSWIVSVLEAVVTMPIIALAHIRTKGEGLVGPMAQSAYLGWLNIMLRPSLVVIGFVMGNLVFESMILYLNDTFNTTISQMGSGGFGIIDQILNTYIYIFSAYSLVNASFKMVDLMPNATVRWLGGPRPASFEEEIFQMQSFGREAVGEVAKAFGQVVPQAAATAGISAGGAVSGGMSGLARGIKGVMGGKS